MTPETIKEWAEALYGRYHKATRREKKIILDEFCATTHYHRKAAIRLLHRSQPSAEPRPERRGRPALYRSGEFMSALLLLWEASGHACGKYLAAGMAGLIERMEQSGSLLLSTALRQQLLQVSGATLDRLLRPHRAARRQPATTPGRRIVSDLSRKIATHTYATLRHLPVGHLEIDLVLHCGLTTGGFYLTTLVGVDIVTSWTECVAVWGKGKSRVQGAAERLRRRLPFTLQGLHSDNGGEFINDLLYQYAQQRTLDFSHGRSYHKNDQPRVEQRNGSVVRRLIGYGRYTTRAAHQQLELLYNLVRLHSNFFQPTSKLLARERRGAKIVKVYDRPQTPYQRLLASGYLTETQRAALEAQYQQLDPLQLQRQITDAIEQLWKLEAIDPASERMRRLQEKARRARVQ